MVDIYPTSHPAKFDIFLGVGRHARIKKHVWLSKNTGSAFLILRRLGRQVIISALHGRYILLLEIIIMIIIIIGDYMLLVLVQEKIFGCVHNSPRFNITIRTSIDILILNKHKERHKLLRWKHTSITIINKRVQPDESVRCSLDIKGIVGDRSRGPPEGSLFNSYYTEV